MFGRIVMGVPAERFEHALEAQKRRRGAAQDVELDADALRELIGEFRAIVRATTGREFPDDPHEQLALAIHACSRAGLANARATIAAFTRSPTISARL